MSLKSIGILSIGEMGYHWARVLGNHGVKVISSADGRSPATCERARSVGVELVPSIEELVSKVDLIVSIVVPFAAKEVADHVARALAKYGRRGLLYMDANAVSPMTAEALARTITQAEAIYVDGCIIGGAAKIDQGTVVYVSGAQAHRLSDLNRSGLRVKVLGAGATQASAFKILHAGLSKGLAGLFTELLVGANALGLLNETMEDYDENYPGLLQKIGNSIASLPVHAKRRSEEMIELRETFAHFGINPLVVPSVETLLKTIADSNSRAPSPAEKRQETLVDTIKLFADRGLLQQNRV
ncbi:MAG: NAD(P)-binding domain-containing protein [Deltaproteobacteria bacterium]|nr:NAD(P)-binding domain-containing protein [Deltaproteobacteria bacterium]